MAPPRLQVPRLGPNVVISHGLGRSGTKHVSAAADRRLNKVKAKSALAKTVCGVYCMIACVFGTVFPISDALAQTESGQHLYYTEVFHCYMYGLGVFSFIYFMCLIMIQRRKLIASGRYDDIQLEVMGSAAPSRRGSRDYGTQKEKLMDKETNPNLPQTLTVNEIPPDGDMEELEKDANVTYEAEGVNFYLRLGAIGFGLGGMVQCGFRISEPFENPHARECRSLLFFIDAALYLIFVFLQTFFIFKYHKAVFHRHKAFVRLCLMHILATNLSVWLSTTTHETAEDIGRMSAESHSGMNKSVISSLLRTREAEANGSVIVVDVTEPSNAELNHIINCHLHHTLSDRSAPYLFPCLIEYSLIGAAVAYRTFLNVGKRVAKGDSVDESAGIQYASEPVECHKSNRGLFLGLLMILVTFVSVALFFVFEEDKHKKAVSSAIFLSTEIFLFIIGIIGCIVGLCYTRRLAYVGLLDEDFFDDKLLLIAQMGVYLLTTCVVISSATALIQSGEDGHVTLSVMYLAMASLNFIESTVQSVFILDGLRRCAASDDQVAQKPGRGVVTFLLVCNLAMWIVNTFEIKKAAVVDIHVDFFQYLPWSIIMHLCLPLVIFYRFHSSVCLSDVWQHAYVKRDVDVLGLSDFIEHTD